MTSVRSRENTFKVDLTNFPKRPSFEELHKFVHEQVGLSIDQVLRLQMNHAQNCAHVKCCDLKTAQDAVEHHNERHVMEVNKSKIKVRLMMDDGGVEVKIHDLSENVRSEDIAAFLKQYGDVISIKELVWGDSFAYKGVSSGVRIAKMILRRHIKSFVSIQGEQSLITYRNQPQTCKHCQNLQHPGSTCVENKKLLGQKVDLNNRLKVAHSKTSTYAGALNGNNIAATIMPEFMGTNLNQLNDLARSSLPNASDNAIASSSRSASTTASQASTLSQTKANATSTAMTIVTANKTTTTAAATVATEATTEATTVATTKATTTATATTTAPTTATTAIATATTTTTLTVGEKRTDKKESVDNPMSETAPKPLEGQHPQPDEINDKANLTVSLRNFKVPAPIPPFNPTVMEISDYESNESSCENAPFQKVKRGRGRTKKPRTTSPPHVSITNT